MLVKLHEFGIQVDVDKCEFYMTETKYLGLIISTKGIKMDPAKIKAIRQWDNPTCIWKVCLFVGFYNFYKRFIRNFLNIAGPLNALTKKNMPLAWTTECKQAFQELKNQVCEDPILCHFDPNKQCFVETDFLDYINASMLLQMSEDDLLHLVAYFLRRMAPAECNYKIYNKELLAIICCFEEWRPELEGTSLPVKVLTNHKGLKYFMTTKKLTLQQVKWAEFLSEFNFVISYQSSKKNDKADTLTQKPNKKSTEDKDKWQQHQIRVLIPPNQINHKAELQSIEENDKEPAKD